jgi:hypothetical protein
MSPSLAQIIDKPDWLCYGLDRDKLLLHFLHVDEQSMDAMVFLGHRGAGAPVTVSYPIEQVFDAVRTIEFARESRFILHTAFCCSTLLARCIDFPGAVRTLRELPVFSGLTPLRNRLRSENKLDLWGRIVTVIDRLSSRPFAAGGTTVNKPSNVFLPSSSDFLEINEASRALVIHSDLPAFLVSCSKKKSAGTRPWIDMYAALDPNLAFAAERGIDIETASAMELACLVWNVQMEILHQLAGNASRIRQLDSAAFLSAPLETVRKAHGWFEIVVADEQRAGVVAREMQRHAKQPGLLFDPARREAEKTLVETHFGREIDSTIEWNRVLFGEWEQVYRHSTRRIAELGAG